MPIYNNKRVKMLIRPDVFPDDLPDEPITVGTETEAAMAEAAAQVGKGHVRSSRFCGGSQTPCTNFVFQASSGLLYSLKHYL